MNLAAGMLIIVTGNSDRSPLTSVDTRGCELPVGARRSAACRARVCVKLPLSSQVPRGWAQA